MNKHIFSTLLLSLTLFFSAQAQKIAVVDITEVLENMADYQKAQELAVEQDKVKALYSKFQAEQVLLSEEMKRQREEEITNKEKEVREMQRQKFGPEGALFKKREELVKPIQDKVYDAISSYASNRGFDFIFDKGAAAGLLFSNPSFDKTADIKAILKK